MSGGIVSFGRARLGAGPAVDRHYVMQQKEPPLAMEFTVTGGRPAVRIPACRALEVVLSYDGYTLDSWPLVDLAAQIRSVLEGRTADGGVGKDEIWAEVSPERVEIVISEMPDGSATYRDELSPRTCLDAIERWRQYLLTLGPTAA